jgi:hypothetical protein
MTEAPGSKRPRLSLPLALSQQQQQQLVSDPHADQEGIIDYFAKRGSRLREMEQENTENSAIIAKLKRESEILRLEVASTKVGNLNFCGVPSALIRPNITACMWWYAEK